MKISDIDSLVREVESAKRKTEASPHKHVDSQDLIKIADGKMYLAKKETGSNICN